MTIQCQSDSDCTLVDDTVDLGICCGIPVCSSYAESKYVAVNAESLRQLTVEAQGGKCDSTICPQYLLTLCNPEGTKYTSKCVDKECAKVPIANVTTDSSASRTHKNEEYGFSFQYPYSWEVGDITNSDFILNPDGQSFKYNLPHIRVYYNSDISGVVEHHGDVGFYLSDMTSELFISEYNSDGDISTVEGSSEEVVIGSLIVTKVIASTAIGLDRVYLFFKEWTNKPLFFSYNEFNEDHLSILESLKIL